MDEKKLKPCPFCGSEKVTVRRIGRDTGSTTVYCADCEARGPVVRGGEGRACYLWNERPSETSSVLEAMCTDEALPCPPLSVTPTFITIKLGGLGKPRLKFEIDYCNNATK